MYRNLWLKVIGLVVAVWMVAGGVMWWMNYTKPTPERIMRYIDENAIEAKKGRDRDRTIEKVASQLNELSYEQRREMRMGKKLDRFFKGLSTDEQSRFLDLTLPAGFKQMMEAFNKMDAEKRKQFVDRTLSDMRKNDNGEAPPMDDPNVQKMVQQGLKSFYTDASADVKMDFAPIIEQMQKNMQFGGR